jgi:hypothetical protein
MARVKATIAVNGIGGRIGGVIYYQLPGREGETFARTQPSVVAQPRTPLQQSNRMLMRGFGCVWARLSAAEKAAWRGRARVGQNGWLAFSGYNYHQAAQGWMPQATPHTTHVDTPAAPTALTAEIVEHVLYVWWVDAAGALATGVHVGPDPDFTPAMTNLVVCEAARAGLTRQATILIAAGTYYVKARSGGEDGGVGVATAGVGPVVIG